LGEPKALLTDTTGEPLVRRAIRQLGEAGCGGVLIVVGAERDRVRGAIESMAHAVTVEILEHDGWTDGMGSSIARGIRHLADGAALRQPLNVASDAPTAALIAAVDMPSVTADHLAQLLAASVGGTRRTASTYAAADGSMIRGIPAVLPRADWPWLAALDGDRGARALFTEAATALVPLDGGALDLDTPADVARWRMADPLHSRLRPPPFP